MVRGIDTGVYILRLLLAHTSQSMFFVTVLYVCGTLAFMTERHAGGEVGYSECRTVMYIYSLPF